MPSYKQELDVARAGQKANMEPCVLISRSVETAAGIKFGVPVARGTQPRGCKVFGAAADKFMGVAVREVGGWTTPEDGFPQYNSARLMTKGVIWVVAKVAVAAGDPVFALATGEWGKAAVAGEAAIPGAQWDTPAAAGALAKIRLG